MGIELFSAVLLVGAAVLLVASAVFMCIAASDRTEASLARAASTAQLKAAREYEERGNKQYEKAVADRELAEKYRADVRRAISQLFGLPSERKSTETNPKN